MKIDDVLRQQMETLEIVLKEDVQYIGPDLFEDVFMVQNSLTPVSIKEVDLSTEFLGKKLNSPIAVAPLVGGHQRLTSVNEKIAEFSKKNNIAMGIGNQYFGLKAKDAIESYSVVRKKNPDGLIIGNLPIKHLIESKTPTEDVQAAIEMIKADAMELYFDPLKQLLWPEKNTGFAGFDTILSNLKEKTNIPLIAKTYSVGFSNEDIRQLWDLGISAVNIQGVGGTSFARINTMASMTLAQKQTDPPVKKPYDFWGIPTLWSLLDVSLRSENHEIPLIVGGGIRNGIQAVKALALGADLVSLGYPILIELMEDFGYPDEKNLFKWFENFILEMKMTMCLLGAKNITELREIARNRIIFFGKTKDWIAGRNLIYPPTKGRDL